MNMQITEGMDKARQLHDRAIVIDTHLDTTQRLRQPDWDFATRHDDGHVDIPRMREGGVGAVFLAAFQAAPVEPGAGVAAAREQIELIRAAVQRHDRDLVFARTARDVERAKRDGRIAVLAAIEGGHLIEDSLEVLREYHSLGASYMTLTHSAHTNWADSAGVHASLKPRHGGLSSFGRDVVREMNRLGVMVDVSHVSDGTFWDVIETSTAPVVATHSCCRSVFAHRRNLTDEMMKAIAASGGTVQINFAAAFLDPDFPQPDPDALKEWAASGGCGTKPVVDHVTPLSLLVDHFECALQAVGPDHVGIGSDFDGVFAVPEGMEDCSKLPNLTAALLSRGYSEDDLAKVLGGNVLRVMDACQAEATRLQA
jgi:membrane dipeptidase